MIKCHFKIIPYSFWLNFSSFKWFSKPKLSIDRGQTIAMIHHSSIIPGIILPSYSPINFSEGIPIDYRLFYNHLVTLLHTFFCFVLLLIQRHLGVGSTLYVVRSSCFITFAKVEFFIHSQTYKLFWVYPQWLWAISESFRNALDNFFAFFLLSEPQIVVQAEESMFLPRWTAWFQVRFLRKLS